MKNLVSAAMVAALVVTGIEGAHAAARKEDYQADASKVPTQMALGCYIALTVMVDRSEFDHNTEEFKPLFKAYEANVDAALKASGQPTTAADIAHQAVRAMTPPPAAADLRKEYDRCWTTADAHMVKFRARPEYATALACWAVKTNETPDDPMVFFYQHDLLFGFSEQDVSVDVRYKALDRAKAEAATALAQPNGAELKARFADCYKTSWAPLRAPIFAPVPYGATLKEKYPDYDLKVGNMRAQGNDHFPREKVSKEILDRLVASGWKFPGYNDPITGEALVASNVWEITPSTFGKWTTMPELAPATICAAALPFRGPADKVPPGSLTYWDIAQEQLQKGGFDFHDATVIIGVLGTYQSIATHWDAKEPCKRWGEAVAKAAGKTLYVPDPPGLQ